MVKRTTIFRINRIFLLLLCGMFWLSGANAQDGDQKAKGLPQLGVFTGRILPHGISGVDEIFALSGARYSHPMSENGYLDFGGLFGNSGGVRWKGAFTSLSMHIPVETLVGHAGLGLDITRYETDGGKAKNIGGLHFIGGIMAQIGGNVLARFDMKLSSKPGTSLFFGIGIVAEMDWGGGGGNANP